MDYRSGPFENDVTWLSSTNGPPEVQQTRLDMDLVDEGLCYGPNPIPVWPVALGIGRGLWEQARHLARGLWACVEPLAQAQADESLRAFWRLTGGEITLIAGSRPGETPCRILRMDCSLTGGVLRVMEINTLFSGLASSDGVAACVARLPGLAAWLADMEAEFPSLAPALANMLGADSPGRVVLLGRPDSDPIVREYEYTLARLADHGLRDAAIASPEDVTLAPGGELMHGDAPIRAIYLRGSFDQWAVETDRLAPILTAARLGNVAVVNPFSSLLVDSKAAFAAMWSERFRADLGPELCSLLEVHVPRSYTLDSAGAARASRDRRLVLKPIDGYGGERVVIGPEKTDSDWERAIEIALRGRYIVQEFVAQPEIPALPGRSGGGFWNLNFVVADGELIGGFARASRSAVVGIATGGAMLPIFIHPEASVVYGQDRADGISQ